jgi:hypothetical protein
MAGGRQAPPSHAGRLGRRRRACGRRRALLAIGAIPDARDVQVSPLNPSERAIRVDGLLDGMPRFTAVLLLHGRVAWFRRDAGAYAIPVIQADNADLGIPIVMLPDLNNDDATDPIISTIWQQFSAALRRARRVLVLGHSLHDEALITALLENVNPRERLAVTVLASENSSQGPSADRNPASARVHELLPGAAVIPIRFDSSLEAGRTDLRDWSANAAAVDGAR